MQGASDVNAALYWTIWVGLTLFATGEIGRATMGARAGARGWPWWAWVAGILATGAHFLLAFAVRHDWSQTAAIRATADQTAAVYGVQWGGGVFVNYLFLAIWTIDAILWRVSPDRHARRSRAVVWILRLFYLTIIVNGAVIFAAGMRRWVGVMIVAAIVWSAGRK